MEALKILALFRGAVLPYIYVIWIIRLSEYYLPIFLTLKKIFKGDNALTRIIIVTQSCKV